MTFARLKASERHQIIGNTCTAHRHALLTATKWWRVRRRSASRVFAKDVCLKAANGEK
jgi:hypothetical protein